MLKTKVVFLRLQTDYYEAPFKEVLSGLQGIWDLFLFLEGQVEKDKADLFKNLGFLDQVPFSTL